MNPLPTWMRVALFATAAMNLSGAFAFLPAAQPLRDLAGFPEAGHPIYVTTVGLFIFVLGLGYLGCAVMNRADRLFIFVGATGKLAFFALLLGLWATDELSAQPVAAGSADLLFGGLFAFYLVQTRPKRG